jgi:hypothetical protein
MTKDLVRGKTIRFTFIDGPMAKKTAEHVFDEGGLVTYRILGADREGAAKQATPGAGKHAHDEKPGTKYEVAAIRDDVVAVSYLGASGYTLTTVLDFKTSELAAFSSNETMLLVQHGTFEVVGSR